MASKAAPSCRLVFCLLISAAVLRPGEQRPRVAPGRRGPGAVSLGPPPRPGPAGQGAQVRRGGKRSAERAQNRPWVPTPVPLFGLGRTDGRLAEVCAASGALGTCPGTSGAAGVGAPGADDLDSPDSPPFPPGAPSQAASSWPLTVRGLKVHAASLQAVFLSLSAGRQ